MVRNRRHRVCPRLVLPFVLVAWAGVALAAPPGAAEGPPTSCGSNTPQTESAPAMMVCDSGGEGATSCETKTTISVSGFGTTSGCGISCTTGFYACCQSAGGGRDAKCACLVEAPHGPFTPEGPSTPIGPITGPAW